MDCLYCCLPLQPPCLFLLVLLSLHKNHASSLLLLSPRSTEGASWERKTGLEPGGGAKGGYYLGADMIMATDALLHFHSCGVAHLWAAIMDQMIQTGPSDEEAGLTE